MQFMWQNLPWTDKTILLWRKLWPVWSAWEQWSVIITCANALGVSGRSRKGIRFTTAKHRLCMMYLLDACCCHLPWTCLPTLSHTNWYETEKIYNLLQCNYILHESGMGKILYKNENRTAPINKLKTFIQNIP